MLGTVPEISRDPVQFVPRLVGPRKVSWFIQVTSVIYSQWISWSTHKRLNIWLVVWNMAFIFHHIWDVILPIDELIFFKMVKTTNQMCIYINYIISYIYIIYIYIYCKIHYIRWIWSLYIWHMRYIYIWWWWSLATPCPSLFGQIPEIWGRPCLWSYALWLVQHSRRYSFCTSMRLGEGFATSHEYNLGH